MEFPRTSATPGGSLGEEPLIAKPSTENSEIKVQTFYRGMRPKIPQNKEIDIEILGAKKGHIYVIIDNAETRKKYAGSKKLMRTFYTSMKGDPKVHLTIEEIEKDMIVAAQLNQEIIRGAVVRTDVYTRKIRLVNVDTLDRLSVSELRVFRMFDQFMEIPFRVIKSKLAGMENYVKGQKIFRAINIESNPEEMPTFSLIPLPHIEDESSLHLTTLQMILSCKLSSTLK